VLPDKRLALIELRLAALEQRAGGVECHQLADERLRMLIRDWSSLPEEIRATIETLRTNVKRTRVDRNTERTRRIDMS
jgi:UDP-N-acetylmuramate-alanine ligase